MRSPFFVRAGATGLALAAALGISSSAAASGPVERIVQAVGHPKDPSVLVLRYGIASEGLLFSRDGGRTYKALCTNAIEQGLDRITAGGSNYTPVMTMDGQGRVLVNTFDAIWSDDGTGCTWSKQEGLDGKWIQSMLAVPESPDEVLAVANVSSGEGNAIVAHSELLRRDATGTWSVVGNLKAPAARTRTYGGDLLAAVSPSGLRLYATIITSTGPLTAPQVTFLVSSSDGGKTWTETPLPDNQQDLVLLAVDPKEPDRVLATMRASNAPDPLLLSEDGGKTFREYGSVQEVSGVVFTPEGRVFIGDAGDGARPDLPGGVLTAERLGATLSRVPTAGMDPPEVDCVQYDAATEKLRVCKVHRFGELDWGTGLFTELTQLERVSELLSCEGRDIAKVCEEQLNAGSAWCCTLHFPFTPFCGQYDVRQMNGRRVACGLAGREAEIAAGRGPQVPPVNADDPAGQGDGGPAVLRSQFGDPGEDTSAADAQVSDAAGGCAVAEPGTRPGWLEGALVGLFGLALARRRRKP